MEWYLLKSALILSILFGFYKLFLENESMHIFKRFYLLASLPVSFLIPLVTFKTYVEMPVSTQTVFITQSVPVESVVAQVNIMPFVLWGIYGLGVVYFAIKFGRNLKILISKIKDNPKLKQNNVTHVLLKNPIVPHTFLSYVFLNKQKYEAHEIPEEVLEHEHVHAKQKHSIDILTIELLQIAFWFNPLLYFVKRSIKLNHEFLADRAVLNLGTDRAVYQNLLLAFSSSAVTPILANSINYSFIKKRFTVMKKQTSTRAIWLRSLLVLPLLAILLYGFSSKEVIQKEVVTEQSQTEEQQESIPLPSKSIIFTINEDESFSINGIPSSLENYKATLKSLFNKFESLDSDEELKVYIKSENHVKWSFIEEIGEELKKYNIVTMNVSSGILDDRNEKIKLTPTNPPAPPVPHIPPRAPELMKLIEEMAENDATFYMDNKKITLEEAYKIAQSQKFNSISSTVCDNQKPILTFSKNFVPAPNDLKLAKEVLERGGELYLNNKKISINEFKNKLEQHTTSKQGYTVNLEKGDIGKDRLRIIIQE